MKHKIINLQQGSEPWLQYRRSKISATDTAKIMNLSPFCTPLQLYEEKMGYREPEKMNSKMEEGMRLESHALNFFNKQNKTDFKPIVLQHGEIDYLMASLDGMNTRGEVLEIKCGKGSHELAKQGIVPEYYLSQVQCQIFCSNVNLAYYFSYRSDEDNVAIIIHRDDEFIEKMKVAVAKFYDMMMTFTPPPATDRDFVNRDDDLWNFHTEKYKLAKLEKTKYQELEDTHRNILISLSDGQSCQGNGIRVSKTLTKGRIQYDSIPQLKEIDLEMYRSKPVTSFRFTEVRDQDE